MKGLPGTKRPYGTPYVGPGSCWRAPDGALVVVDEIVKIAGRWRVLAFVPAVHASDPSRTFTMSLGHFCEAHEYAGRLAGLLGEPGEIADISLTERERGALGLADEE